MITEELKAQVSKVISYSQNIENPQIDELLKNWSLNKRRLYARFNDNLILDLGKHTFELGEESKKQRLETFQDWVCKYEPLTDDLYEFLRNISPDEFYNNRLENSYDYKDKTIGKGHKVIKAFKHFISNDILLTDLQNRASEIIQENKIEGTLCLSIHPLDFLSSSENISNWRSCHSLDGEYRAGNLSYMQDKHTMICYLRSDEDAKLPNFPNDIPWNNKKWRCLIYWDDFNSPQCVFAGRPYPFKAEGAMAAVRDALIPILNKNSGYWRTDWSNWHDDIVKGYSFDNGETLEFLDRYYPIGSKLYKEDDLVVDTPQSLQFNDLLYSSCYEPVYMFRLGYSVVASKFNIGQPVKCLRCGKAHIDTKDTMMCRICEIAFGNGDGGDYSSCDCCGRRYVSDESFWVEDDMICPDCATNHTFICPVCNYRYYNTEQVFDEANSRYICKHCKEED